MNEIGKTAWSFIVEDIPRTVIIALFIFSIFFKIPQKEVNILGWLLGKLGNLFLGTVRKDIHELRVENASKFQEVKSDRAAKIAELKEDYVSQISGLQNDLDNFKAASETTMKEIRRGNDENCLKMQTRLDDIERKQDMQSVARIRSRVLNFSEDLRRGNLRTHEDFSNIFAEDREYCAIVEAYHLENNVYKHAINFINKKYDEFLENDGFAKY